MVRLEDVHAKSDDDYWGTALRSTYGGAGKRKVEDRATVIVAGIIRMAEAKRNNIQVEERRRLAQAEAARRRAEEARRAALRAKRDEVLKAIENERVELDRLETLLAGLEARAGVDPPVHYRRLLSWVRQQRDEKLGLLGPGNLEVWLEEQGCFEADTFGA